LATAAGPSTRPRLITALRTLQGKREAGPKRKHGNIPL
jgi:propionyl-CoA carboxylase beta chain